MSICIVEQLGLAIILSSFSITKPLISGTTSLCLEHILQYEELSITLHPFSANIGPHFFDTSLPAENNAKSTFSFCKSSNCIILCSAPLNVTFWPADLSDATAKNLVTGKIEISSHNHGFSVKEESLPSFVEVTHRSLNDNSVEGIKAEKLNAFSVQYHPESCPGPHDSRYLFDDFIKMIKK